MTDTIDVNEVEETGFLLLDAGQIRQPVRIEMPSGKTEDLILVEASGPARDKFMTNNARKTKFIDGKPQGLNSYEGVQSTLLALVLFRMNPNETLKDLPETIDPSTHQLVSKKEIDGLPARIQQVLFDREMKMSGLDKAGQEAIKNDSTGTEENGSNGAG